MKNKILTILFAVLLGAGAVIIWLPADKDSVARENRAMASFPDVNPSTLTNGEFTNRFGDYLDDTVGFRGPLTDFSNLVQSSAGFTSELGKVVSVNKDVGTSATKKSRLLVTDDTIMEVFENNREHMDWYLNVLEFYSEHIDKGVNLYSMLIPTQLEFKEPVYSNIQDKQKDTINYIYRNMPDRVIPVNAYDKLKAHSDEYIYYRTDHHWTARGAYYAYTALMETMAQRLEKPITASPSAAPKEKVKSLFEPVNLSDYAMGRKTGFYGYLYRQAQNPDIKPDTIEWYDVNVDEHLNISDEYYENGQSIKYDSVIFAKDKNDYSLFLGGDQPLAELTNTKRPNGRTMLIIKDSYCNCFAPWVIENFGKVILIDPRTYNGSMKELLERYKPDDLLLMNYIFTTTFPDYCQMTIDFCSR